LNRDDLQRSNSPLASTAAVERLPITAIVAVKNEAANLQRCLDALVPCERVIVVDSQSTDATPEIARGCGADVLQFRTDGSWRKKRQWALDTAEVVSPWVLLVDADEVIPPDLWAEIRSELMTPKPATGYLVCKGFWFLGRQFRFGGFSFNAVVLFQTGQARFEQLDADPSGLDMEVHERLIVDGPLRRLATPLIHHDQKGLAAFIDKHNRYSTWEAAARHRFLTTGRWGADAIRPRLWGNIQERRRALKQWACRLPGEPWLWFLYHYIFCCGFLEGWRGYLASRFRAQYIADVRAKLYELSLRNGRHSSQNAELASTVATQ
jgi:glycosyltransferase involved in cell wall biosynthesis